MDVEGADHRGQMRSDLFVSREQLSGELITVNVNFGHVAEGMLSVFPVVKLTFSLCSLCVSYLGESQYVEPTLQGRGVSPSTWHTLAVCCASNASTWDTFIQPNS